MVTVHDSLVSEIDILTFYCWTDSQISLPWIQATNQEFKLFLENRVNAIRKLVALKLCNYCKTNENPVTVTRISKHDFHFVTSSQRDHEVAPLIHFDLAEFIHETT